MLGIAASVSEIPCGLSSYIKEGGLWSRDCLFFFFMVEHSVPGGPAFHLDPLGIGRTKLTENNKMCLHKMLYYTIDWSTAQ